MKKVLPALLLAVTLTWATMASAMEPGGFRDTFDAYNQENWAETIGSGGVLVQTGAWMRNINVRDGRLHIAPPAGQEFVSSNLEFEASDLSFEAEFGTFGTSDSPVFYYLGFRGAQDACYFMVQEGALVAVLNKGGVGRAAQACGHLETGKVYKFGIQRRPGSVEMFLDGNKVFATTAADDIPHAPMPVWFGGNVLGNPTASGARVETTGLPAASVWIDNVEVRDVIAEKTAAAADAGAVSGETLRVESSAGVLSLLSGAGVAWDGIANKKSGGQLMAEAGRGTPVFLIDAGDHRYPSTEFAVEGTEQTKSGGVVIRLAHREAALRAVLTAEPDAKTGAFRLGLEIENAGREARELQTTFPALGPLLLGGGPDDLEYFYPWRTGIQGRVNCKLTNEYGAGCWTQVVALWNAKTGNALYCYPEDSTGRVKGMHFTKLGAKQPLIRHGEPIYPFVARPPFKFREGAGFTYYYVPRSLAPGEKQSFPATKLAIHGGDWREALADYRQWSRGWYRPADTPAWFLRAYTFVPRHPHRFWSPEKKRYIYSENLGADGVGADGGEDIVQWGFWWDYDEKTAANPGKNVLENHNYGDYDYNVSRGGLKAFKEEIQKLQAKGIRFSVYTNFRFAWTASRVGKKHGEEWAAMYAPGKFGYYTNPDDKWMMSMYEPGMWADFYAETCARIVRDTGMDGIYLDELMFPFANYNPAHAKFHGGESPVPVKLLGENVTKLRRAVRQANPEATVMTEHAGSDWLSQSIDGCWVQTFYPAAFPFAERYFDDNSLVYFRFLFPGLKLSEWGGGLDSPRRSLFNGIGIDSNSYSDEPEKFAEQRALIPVFRTVFHEVADAFATKEPEMLVPTRAARLLANRFASQGKTVYTLYNKTGSEFRGPAIEVDGDPGLHWVELVADRALAAKPGPDGKTVLELDLPDRTVAVVAGLPRVLDASLDKDALTVRAKQTPEGGRIEVAAGDKTISAPAGAEASLDLAPLGDAREFAVKLLDRDGVLVDQVMVAR